MPEYFFRDAPLSETELGVASALNRAHARANLPEERVYWNETVLLIANTLFERNDWSNNQTHSMHKYTNFLDLCRYDTDKDTGFLKP